MANESASIPAATGVSKTDSYSNLGVEAISQAVPVTQAVTETQSSSGHPEQQPAKKKEKRWNPEQSVGSILLKRRMKQGALLRNANIVVKFSVLTQK